LRALIRSSFVVAALLMASVQSAFASVAPTTPSLTGELLNGDNVTTSGNSHCNADGTGYFTFSASGTAGPVYAGTFREWGIVAITMKNGLFYENFAAAFVINSTAPNATIYGTKEEVPPETFLPPPGFRCSQYTFAGSTGYQTYGNARPNIYQAAIYTGGNTYYDQGSTDLAFTECRTTLCGTFFSENFKSNLGALLTPASNGGN
jgi:hypothetical protein